MRNADIFDNEDFMEWLNGRPLCIQKVIRSYPPDVEYKLNGLFPVNIHSYDEEKDGNISLTVDVHSPFMPRRVFGVNPESLQEAVA